MIQTVSAEDQLSLPSAPVHGSCQALEQTYPLERGWEAQDGIKTAEDSGSTELVECSLCP